MKKITLIIFTIVSLGTTIETFACSGEGARALTTFNDSVSSVLFGIAVLIVLAIYVLLRKKNQIKKLRFAPWLAFLILLIQPRIWLNAYSGDCGYTILYASITMTIILLLVLAVTYYRSNTINH